MGHDPAQRGQRDVGRGGQAVVDLPGLLAHDRQLVLAQQRVDLVDAARRGVLDRQHGQVAVAGQQRGGRLAEGAVAGQVAVQPAAGQVLLRGGVAVGVRGALEGDPDAAAVLRGQVPGLLRDRVAEQLAEDPAHQAGRHAEVRGHGLYARQHRALAVGVLDLGCPLLLGLRDRGDDAAAPRDEVHDPAVHVIQALAQAGDVLLLAHYPPSRARLTQRFYHCRRPRGPSRARRPGTGWRPGRVTRPPRSAPPARPRRASSVPIRLISCGPIADSA